MDHAEQDLDLVEEEDRDIVVVDSEHGGEWEVVDDIPAGLGDDLPTAVVEDTAVVREDIALVCLDLAAADTSFCRHREQHRVVVQAEIVAHIPGIPAAEGKVDDYGLPSMRS